MKWIKYFIYFTAAVDIYSTIVLLVEGTLDIWTIWMVATSVLASYYIYNNEKVRG